MIEDDVQPGFEGLVEAIIKQAAKDVRNYKPNRRIESKRQQQYQEYSKRHCEDAQRFFRSEWFAFLTGFDGKRILKMLQEEKDANQNRDI